MSLLCAILVLREWANGRDNTKHLETMWALFSIADALWAMLIWKVVVR